MKNVKTPKIKIVDEFKSFAMRGNVVDMAVGIIIGAAFGKIVSSAVSDIFMPLLGTLVGGVSFSDLTATLKHVSVEGGKVVTTDVIMTYGNFIQTIFDFIIIAFSIFLFIKLINRVTVKKEAEKATPAEPSADIKLLTEIRDLLKKQEENKADK